jgi:hypothetical protein
MTKTAGTVFAAICVLALFAFLCIPHGSSGPLAENIGRWRVAESIDDIDHHETWTITQLSAASETELTIGCANKAPGRPVMVNGIAFWGTDHHIYGNPLPDVRYRFEDDIPRDVLLIGGGEGLAFPFSGPSAADDPKYGRPARAFLNQLLSHHRLWIDLSGGGFSRAQQFDLDGLPEILDRIRCSAK